MAKGNLLGPKAGILFDGLTSSPLHVFPLFPPSGPICLLLRLFPNIAKPRHTIPHCPGVHLRTGGAKRISLNKWSVPHVPRPHITGSVMTAQGRWRSASRTIHLWRCWTSQVRCVSFVFEACLQPSNHPAFFDEKGIAGTCGRTVKTCGEALHHRPCRFQPNV